MAIVDSLSQKGGSTGKTPVRLFSSSIGLCDALSGICTRRLILCVFWGGGDQGPHKRFGKVAFVERYRTVIANVGELPAIVNLLVSGDARWQRAKAISTETIWKGWATGLLFMREQRDCSLN